VKKRVIDIAVISNLNLGSCACRAEEFLTYLSSIKPAILIFTGEITVSSFTGNTALPQAQFRIILKLIELATANTEIIYIGNKNDREANKIAQKVNARFKICKGLDLKIGKACVQFISDREFFEIGSDVRKMHRIIDRALKHGFTHLIISAKGKSKKQWLETQQGELCVMHSGDWTQSLSALEYAFKRWKIYHYSEDKLAAFYADEALKAMNYDDLEASLPNPESN
jgi:dihydroxyacetone kinase-like predicted kinase